MNNDKISSTTEWVKPAAIYKIYKITPTTLIKWADKNQVKYIRSPNGYRLYDLKSINFKYSNVDLQATQSKPKDKVSYCYCRVSTKGQQEDLLRQIAFMQDKYPSHEIISDIGSGLNFNRKGLKTLLEQAYKGNVKEVVVAYKDRLCRFGYELLEWIFSKYNINLVVLNTTIQNSPESELTTDLLSILNVFSAKINGRRKYKNKQKTIHNKKDENKTNELPI